MKNKINNFIIDFFKTHTTEDVWTCMHALETTFNLSTPVAYGYVSKYVSNEFWKIHDNK